MILRPFEYITKYIKDKVERTRKLDEYIHTHVDSFIAWIIGFSFSGILLIASDLTTFIPKQPTKGIILCLSISIVFGVLFRVVSFLIILFQKSLDDYFFGLLSEEDMTPVFLEDDIDKMEFHELLKLIKDDFGHDIYPDANPNVPLPDDLKKSEEVRLRKHYLALIEHSKKEFDIAVNHIAEVDETAYKIKKEKTVAKLKNLKEALESSKIGYNQRRWYLARVILYLLCLLSFLTAVSILCISLLLTPNTEEVISQANSAHFRPPESWLALNSSAISFLTA